MVRGENVSENVESFSARLILSLMWCSLSPPLARRLLAVPGFHLARHLRGGKQLAACKPEFSDLAGLRARARDLFAVAAEAAGKRNASCGAPGDLQLGGIRHRIGEAG